MNIRKFCNQLAASATLAAVGFSTSGCVTVNEQPHAAHVTTDAGKRMQQGATESGKLANPSGLTVSSEPSNQLSMPEDFKRNRSEQLAIAPESTVVR